VNFRPSKIVPHRFYIFFVSREMLFKSVKIVENRMIEKYSKSDAKVNAELIWINRFDDSSSREYKFSTSAKLKS